MEAELSNPLQQAVKDRHIIVDDTGSTRHIFDFEKEEPIDRVVIVFRTDDKIPNVLQIYNERSSDKPDAKIPFKERNVSFEPISVIGRGETDELRGLAPAGKSHERSYTSRDDDGDSRTPIINSYDEIPEVAKDVWKSEGFSVIPSGEEWYL